jgi:hypothetical protein
MMFVASRLPASDMKNHLTRSVLIFISTRSVSKTRAHRAVTPFRPLKSSVAHTRSWSLAGVESTPAVATRGEAATTSYRRGKSTPNRPNATAMRWASLGSCACHDATTPRCPHS